MQLETYAPFTYVTLCNKEERERIINISSAEDYLLKLRANATVEHTRIFRVILAKRRKMDESWSLSSYFDDQVFKNDILNLNDRDTEVARALTAGIVFCDSPNGRIIKTDYGNVITISASLRYFLYFMNLAILEFGDKNSVPSNVRSYALRIAIRTMLQTEALDFDIDPRGEIPIEIDNECKWHTDKQLEFVVGHEYSHHFLGHLDSENIIERPLMSVLEPNDFKHKTFSYSQQDELAADIDAIERPNFSEEKREDTLNRALFFFIYLDIYQSVKEQIHPSMGRYKTHPEPIDRFYNLYTHFKDRITLNEKNLEALMETRTMLKDLLQDEVATNIEFYEFYGSVYLGEWRGKVLRDRIDF